MKSRVVLDTNIYVSALMKSASTPGRVFKKIIQGSAYELVVSEAILDEIRRVLFYPKVRKYIRGTDDEIKHWIQSISMIAHIVYPENQDQVIVHEDPDDDKFILAALEARAKVLVSGDTHLLKLKKYQGINIITPQAFISSNL